MYGSLKEVFDKHFKHIKATPQLADRIRLYGNAFVNKNEDHIQFFGGNLMGVSTVRFVSADKYDFVEDILQIDELEVKADVKQVETIDPDWVRGTDVMNLSCIYMTYIFFNSDLPEKKKYDAMFNTLLVLHYKLISSLLAWFFKYPANEQAMLATYAVLSKKFAIKQYGTWGKVFEARCHDILAEFEKPKQGKDEDTKINQAINNTFRRFDDDDGCQYLITDIQGRLRAMVKKIWEVFEEVHTTDSKFSTVSSLVELDGKMVVRDIQSQYGGYRLYAEQIIVSEAAFIKPELFPFVFESVKTLHQESFGLVIKQFVHMANEKSDSVPNRLTQQVVEHAISAISERPDIRSKVQNIPVFLDRMKSLYQSAKSSDPLLLSMRKDADLIVTKTKEIKSKDPSILASLRTGLMLYILFRTFTKDYYK